MQEKQRKERESGRNPQGDIENITSPYQKINDNAKLFYSNFRNFYSTSYSMGGLGFAKMPGQGI